MGDDYDDEEEGEEEWESEDSWESDVDSEAEIAEIMQLDLAEENQHSGKQEYLLKCNDLKIVPVAMFIAKLDCEHINLRHHGMGVKGAISISAALQVNTKIRSLNLGDNWFGNEGVHALAEVLATNTTLTSINLSDNRVGLPGCRSLCRRLQENNTLAELNLKGNNLDDRAAVPLSEALRNSNSLTKIDLSYNSFGEESGKLFGEMLNGHSHLLEACDAACPCGLSASLHCLGPHHPLPTRAGRRYRSHPMFSDELDLRCPGESQVELSSRQRRCCGGRRHQE